MKRGKVKNLIQRPISHEICLGCVRKFQKNESCSEEFLTNMSGAVLLVDENRRILDANDAGFKAAGKMDPHRIRGLQLGEVFECTHALLSEGCGNTVHCRCCTIHRMVEDCQLTARRHLQVPAFSDKLIYHNIRSIRFLISTEKIGNHILLRIDAVRNSR